MHYFSLFHQRFDVSQHGFNIISPNDIFYILTTAALEDTDVHLWTFGLKFNTIQAPSSLKQFVFNRIHVEEQNSRPLKIAIVI